MGKPSFRLLVELRQLERLLENIEHIAKIDDEDAEISLALGMWHDLEHLYPDIHRVIHDDTFM